MISFPFTLGILIAVLSVVFHYLPTPLNPVRWKNPNKLPELIPNNVLQASILHKYDFSGPECFTASELDGIVYTGVSDGSVVSLTSDGSFRNRVFFVGGYILQGKQGNGFNSEESLSLFEQCKSMAMNGSLGWNKSKEKQCGRPLGLRYVKNEGKGILLILDAYWGLFQLSLDAPLEIIHLFGPDHPIQKIPNLPIVQNKNEHLYDIPQFYNDLDVLSPSGDVIFSDSSYKFTRSENRPEILDGAGRGRLFHFNMTSKSLSVLLCGLHFPNGVQTMQNLNDNDTVLDETIIFAELSRFRLIKVNISSVVQHAYDLLSDCHEEGSYDQAIRNSTSGVSIFSDNLPGLPDNVRADTFFKKRGHYLIGFGSKSSQPFSLLWLAFQSNWLRIIVGKLIPMRLVEHLVPRYGLVFVVDHNGNIVSTLQDPDGSKVALVSVAFRHPLTGDVWLGSHSEHYIAILPKDKLPPEWGI